MLVWGVCSAVMALMLVQAFAAPGELDTTFGGTGIVKTDAGEYHEGGQGMVLQRDGKIVQVGDEGFTVIRLLPDGTLDTSFGGTGIVRISRGNHYAYAVALQNDGRIVVAGVDHDSISVARFLPDGTLDAAFGTPHPDYTGVGFTTVPAADSFPRVVDCAIQSDGKIVVAGTDDDNFFAMRFHTTGTLDTTFSGDGKVSTDLGGTDYAYAMALQPDNRILVAGSRGLATVTTLAVLRYNTDGSLDTTWNGTGQVFTPVLLHSEANSVQVLPDGKVLVGGYTVVSARAGGDFAVIRYHSDGSLDTSFNGTGKATVDFGSDYDMGFSAVAQRNGRVVVAGVINYGVSNGNLAVTRLNANGTLDTTFGQMGKVTTDIGKWGYSDGVQALVQTDGKILIGGTAPAASPPGYDFFVLRYLGDLAPEIVVEHPVGSPLVDGNFATPIDFGEATAATPTTKTFKIKNTGAGVLNVRAITFSGPDASAFSVSSAPAATVDPITGSTQFTVRFTGGNRGSRSAFMHIATNDEDETSFDVGLSGTALYLVAFGGTHLVAREVAGVVQIPVLRTGGGTVG